MSETNEQHEISDIDEYLEKAIQAAYEGDMLGVATVMGNHIDPMALTTELRDQMSAAVHNIYMLGAVAGVEIGMAVHHTVMHEPEKPEL